MRYVVFCILVAVVTAACGKRPNIVEPPTGSTFPRAYPAVVEEPQ